VTGAAALEVAAAGAPEAADLIRIVAARTGRRLDALALEALAYGPIGPARAQRLADAVGYLLERDLANMHTAEQLAPLEQRDASVALAASLEAGLRERAFAIADQIGTAYGGPPMEIADDDHARAIPTRLTGVEHLPHGVPGLAYADMVALASQMGGRDPAVILESLQVIVDSLWSRCDGAADIAALARGIGHEFDFDLAPAHIHTLASGLARAGFVALSGA
jgi:hypothetical protein